MSGGMKDIAYPNEGGRPVDLQDIMVLFNNYRLRKFLLQMLVAAGKTDLSSCRILEAGCAGGEQTRFLLENRADPFKSHCLDHSMRAMRLCRRLSPPTLPLTCASALCMPYAAGSFDIVLCLSLFCCFRTREEHRRLASELRRVIRYDGLLLVMDINQNFRTAYSRKMNEKFTSFDTVQNEMEGVLTPEFAVSARKDLFHSEGVPILKKPDGTSVFMAPVQLPIFEMDMEQGRYPMCYTLYSFRPR